jgi:hypothetical protein
MRRHSSVLASALLCSVIAGAAFVGTGVASAGPRATTTVDSQLNSVSCASAAACTAVGFATAKGVEVPLAESWNGKAWTAAKLPEPTGFDRGELYTVSCPTAAFCSAVGDYDNSTGAQLMLAENWNGKAWAVAATPAPADYYGQALQGVACPSATACYAVGTYFKGSGQEVTIAEYWNGKTWATQTTPSGTPKDLWGVSCSSTSSCLAVGYYSKGASNELALAEDWNGKVWGSQTAPDPKGSQGTYLSTISCVSAKACAAVGNYQGSSGLLGASEIWNGKTWAVAATPAPASGDSDTLNTVSCISATACTAVGFSQDSAGNNTVIVESWNGKSWAAETAVEPTSATSATLQGISCASATACMATGSYKKGTNTYNLAEYWNGKSWAVETVPNG